MTNLVNLLARLRAPLRIGGTTSEDAYEIFDDLRLEAANTIERLVKERDRARWGKSEPSYTPPIEP